MTAAAERKFPVYARGELRELTLARFRSGLRQLTNPDTGAAFTEEEIALATGRLTNWHARADALDLVLMGQQSRALWLADQGFPQRAATSWLRDEHATQWGLTPLPAAGGTGTISAPATVGTTFVGSMTLGDPLADKLVHKATGKLYQVLITEGPISVSPGVVVVRAVDTGTDTNLAVSTELEWQGKVGPTANPTVSVQFQGGVEAETDAEFALRILDTIRYKQGAGNRAEWRAWTRAADPSIADAFVYPCAFSANSILIAPTGKRGGVTGPAGRIPPAGVMTTVAALLTPPGSATTPVQPYVVYTPPVQEPVDMVIGIAMSKGVSAGWADVDPWPETNGSGDECTITALTNQTTFQITRATGSADLPSSGAVPSLMAWNATAGRWESLNVQSVTLNAGDIYDVVLSAAPSMTLATGVYISPDTARRSLIASTIEAYFDQLGPGEVVNLTTDIRGARAFRFPEPQQQYPQRAGASVIGWLEEALGGSLTDSTVESQSKSTPTVPTDAVSGPNLLVTGKIGIHPL